MSITCISFQKVLCTHLLGKRAGLLGRVEDFVVEDGEVESQAQPDGVCWLHVLLADVEGVLVGLLRVLHRVFTTQRDTSHLLFLLHSVTIHISLNDASYIDKLCIKTAFTRGPSFLWPAMNILLRQQPQPTTFWYMGQGCAQLVDYLFKMLLIWLVSTRYKLVIKLIIIILLMWATCRSHF